MVGLAYRLALLERAPIGHVRGTYGLLFGSLRSPKLAPFSMVGLAYRLAF
jgi:hypothetical protein